MGKQGPCHHCGVTSTPLWRNGPPEKPVLCNACGSRWRTKGSLANYFPLHLREFPSLTENKIPKMKSISFKQSERKPYSKKKSNPVVDRPGYIAQIKRETPYCGQNFPKGLEEEISNRSSSGSVISYSESCVHFDTTDSNELKASAQSDAWEPLVPSEQKTDITSNSAHVVKLTKDLYTILHEQSSYLSGPSEDELLFESEAPTGSIEIGHGGVLIKVPDPKFIDEESEASSLPVESKSYISNEAYSESSSFLVPHESKGTDNAHIDSIKIAKSTAIVAQNHVKRDKSSSGNLHILQDRESPLVSIDLKDVVSFEAFAQFLSFEEQRQLMKYLPHVDTAKADKSIKSLLRSPQFLETLLCFQHLLAEGVFDVSFLEENILESKILRKLLLNDVTKSMWVEYYKQLKDLKHKGGSCQKEGTVLLNVPEPSDPFSLKRPLDNQNQNCSELKHTIRSSKRSSKGGEGSSLKSNQFDSSFRGEEASFSGGNLFALPSAKNTITASLLTTDDTSVQDLLVDIPFNGSFPEAELLFNPSQEASFNPS